MNIGLYFGSFNPIHNGHLIIANYILNETGLEKIWFVVSPQNPFKKENTLLNEYDRLHLVRLAVEEDPRIKVSEIEFKLSKPSYTANTLISLEEKYRDHNFSIIMGSDSYLNITNWKNYNSVISNYEVYVYKRPGHEVKEKYGGKTTILKSPVIDISASNIREYISSGKSIRYLVPETVREEIETRKFYKKKI